MHLGSKILNNFFNSFYRCILRIGTGCPISNLYWATGSLLVENIILRNKLVFYFHLINLPPDSLGKEVIDIQIKHSLPGLATQLADHISKLGNPQFASKWQWKRAVGSYVESLNKHQLLNKIKGYKKLNYDDFLSEEFGRKTYFYNSSLNTL